MILLFSDMNYDREWAAGLLAETFSYIQTAAVLPLVHEGKHRLEQEMVQDQHEQAETDHRPQQYG